MKATRKDENIARSREYQLSPMSEHTPDFNVHAARRLEDIRFSMLLQETAVQRETDLNALLRKYAAQGIAISGARLKGEMEIIFAAFESLIDKAIAYRKELAVKAPELLLPFPYLKEFQTKLDQCAAGAVMALRARHEGNIAKQLPAGAIDAVMGEAVRKTSALKARINNEIQAMALEGTIGLHQRNEPQVTNLNISNSTIANLNLGTVVGDLNGSIQTLNTVGQADLAEAVRQLSEAISASNESVHKKEMLEDLAYVSDQAAQPVEERKKGPLKASIKALQTGLSLATQLVPLWMRVEEALKQMGIHF